MAKSIIKLCQYERILAVVPEPASGPGWANSPVWVYIEDSRHKNLRTECLQPDEQSPEMRALYPLGAMMHRQLLSSVSVRNVREFGYFEKSGVKLWTEPGSVKIKDGSEA